MHKSNRDHLWWWWWCNERQSSGPHVVRKEGEGKRQPTVTTTSARGCRSLKRQWIGSCWQWPWLTCYLYNGLAMHMEVTSCGSVGCHMHFPLPPLSLPYACAALYLVFQYIRHCVKQNLYKLSTGQNTFENMVNIYRCLVIIMHRTIQCHSMSYYSNKVIYSIKSGSCLNFGWCKS